MGEKTDQIERHIEEQRAELGDNINELQQKVKDTFDWRAQFEEHPMVMVGIAVGSGLLLSALVGGRSRSRNRIPVERWHAENLPTAEADASGKTYRPVTYSDPGRDVSYTTRPESESWRNIKSALTGVAIAQVGQLLDSVIPGFTDEYNKAKKGNGTFTANPTD